MQSCQSVCGCASVWVCVCVGGCCSCQSVTPPTCSGVIGLHSCVGEGAPCCAHVRPPSRDHSARGLWQRRDKTASNKRPVLRAIVWARFWTRPSYSHSASILFCEYRLRARRTCPASLLRSPYVHMRKYSILQKTSSTWMRARS